MDSIDNSAKPAIIEPAHVDQSASEKALITTSSGLQYRDEKLGDGSSPQKGQTVLVHYTGRLSSGEKFDSSYDRGQPLSFVHGVGQVIKGWDEGLSHMKVGGKRTLIIPSNLAYGSARVGTIPPNSTLTFEVELVDIQ